MASVWKHPTCKNWFARFRGTAGRTVNRSTGVTDRKEAQRIADSWQLEAQRAVAREVSPGGISDAIMRAERLARLGRLDAPAAREIINDLLAAAGEERMDAQSNRKLCEDWRDAKLPTAGRRARYLYKFVVKSWLDFLDRRASKPIESIGKPDAIAFRDDLLANGYAPRSVNQTMKVVRSIYEEAKDQGQLSRNPFAAIKAQPLDRETRREPFTPADVSKLLATAQGDWKGMILLSATTGLRLMDCARLEWRAIDRTQRTIAVTTRKTGMKLTLPIHPALWAWLAEQTRGIGAARVFPNLAHSQEHLSNVFKGLMEKAGVLAGVARTANGKGRNTCRKSFHSLRHFAATALASTGVRADVARSITGHTDAETHANYVSADIKTLRAAVEGIRLGL